MMGTGMRFGPLRGENRFYVPSKGRKNQNQQKQARRGKKGDETERLDSSPTSKDPPNSLTKPLELPLKPASNLDRFLESTTPLVPAQQAGEESDYDYYRDSSSDGSSDHESDKGIKFTREQLVHNHLRGEVPIRLARLSITNDHTARQQGFSSDDFEAGNSQGRLLFEFLEQDLPYCREPLADKILDLACRYPGLRTLRSCDLLPASWMSVAWYPIYRIPTGPTLKDLDACFLTYHTLSAPMTGSGSTQASIIYPSEIDDVPKISMRAFGMASYKLKGCMWAQHGASESQLANSLMQAADSWLRLLQVNHPDFKFFASHGMH